MSDNFKWDGDMYQGTPKPDEEPKYERYPVEQEQPRQTEAEAEEQPQRETAEEVPQPQPQPRRQSYWESRGYDRDGRRTGTPNTDWNPYPNQNQNYGQQREPREKKPGGLGRKFGVTVATAVVFGLVAGTVFLGVNRVGERLPSARYSQAGTELPNTPLLSPTEVPQSTTAETSAGTSVAAVAKSAMPSVVAITSVSVQEIPDFFGFGTQKYQGISSGSGVIVGENEKELLIATNNHVVADASELSVCFIGDDVVAAQKIQENLSNNGGLDTKGAVSAQVKGTEPANDLAVISVKKADIPEETMAQIKIAQIGNSDKLEVGEQVVAIGNALGYGQSVTSGWISALNREVAFEGGNSAQMIQTDAAINPGNSGGALLNMQGQLIGINSAKEAANAVEGMGYSIPITKASPILDELMTRVTREKVDEKDSAYFGIEVRELSEEAIQMYELPQGAFVSGVTQGSAAEKAGMKKGDIITKLDGQTIASRDDLFAKMAYYKKGETVEVVVHRADNGEYVPKTLTVTFGARPRDLK